MRKAEIPKVIRPSAFFWASCRTWSLVSPWRTASSLVLTSKFHSRGLMLLVFAPLGQGKCIAPFAPFRRPLIYGGRWQILQGNVNGSGEQVVRGQRSENATFHAAATKSSGMGVDC
jgi:hypothetical protein